MYISLIIHFYILLIIGITADKNFLDMLLHPLKYQNKESELENVIVETETESKEKPEKGKLSDKANINKAYKTGEEKYNYFNPVLSPNKSKPVPPQNPVNEKNKNDENGKDAISIEDVNHQKLAPAEASDNRTSFFDPDKPFDVTMNNQGDISLATIPEEFASYFLNVQKKVGESWMNFFPVFQYYQGIIKSGEVIVRFWIDEKGNPVNPTLMKSYGYQILDEACVNAILYARNFGPLPQALRKNKYISIEFKFIYMTKEKD